MEAYSEFAAVYDEFMDNIPYDTWCEYLTGLLKDDGIEDGLILDLGCGTGNMTEALRKKGYDMIGVDYSQEMLSVAMEKAAQADDTEDDGLSQILYLCQDMREFELYGTVRAIVSICDCMNYILEEEDLMTVFRLANNYLDPEGVFIFDMNTPYKYREILGEQTIAETREDHCFIWDNYFDEEEEINEYVLNLFIQGEDGRYDRHEEVHYQRAWEPEKVIEMIKESGMEFVAAYDAFTKEPVKENSERIYIIAREKGKKINE